MANVGLHTVETMPSAVSRPDRKVIVTTKLDELGAHRRAWQDLADHAVDPNIFFEPAFLFPAIRNYSRHQKVKIVLVYSKQPGRNGERQLCGVFPLVDSWGFHRFPVRARSTWNYLHCFLGTPLVRKEGARVTIACFIDWLRESDGPTVMEFRNINDGPFAKLLRQVIGERRLTFWVANSSQRALFVPRKSAEEYIREAISGRHYKGVRRLERRLAEQGALTYEELRPNGNVDAWIEEFLALEARGWKGEQDTALICSPADREFFTTVLRDFHAAGKLIMLALRQNGRALAMKCNFLSTGGSFAFKIAYDESLRRYSPGVLLEIENIRRLHKNQRTPWMDSCAYPDHVMINRIWMDRRPMQTLALSTGKAFGNIIIASARRLRAIYRIIQRPKSPRRSASEVDDEEEDK